MMILKCVKIYYLNDRIYALELIDFYGNYIVISSGEAKKLIRNNKIRIINIRLKSNNTLLIDRGCPCRIDTRLINCVESLALNNENIDVEYLD